MFFGESGIFKIESTAEPDPRFSVVPRTGVYGRIRLHFDEFQVGHFDEPCCALGPIAAHLSEKAAPEYAAWDASLENLTPVEIFARLDLLLFAYDHTSASLVDPFWVPEAPDGLKRCGFLTNASEAFNGWKGFLLAPPDEDLLAVIGVHSNQAIRHFRIPRSEYTSAVRHFELWLDETRNRLSI